MDRLFANGTVNAAEVGEGPPLFLFHSLLSDRASFDAIVPLMSRSFRVIVPELPGFGRSRAISGGLVEVADRMAEAVKDAAGGLTGDGSLQLEGKLDQAEGKVQDAVGKVERKLGRSRRAKERS